tara:strand:+ start:590 stop:1582 length:993 start_codon:yes stop_codon:yes gene_type:complete
MAYIGKSPQVGNYIKLDAISTSSTNTYNLTQDSVAFVPESALHMLVSLNGVIQSPLSSFSVSGSTITFLPSSGTLSSSDTIDFILVLGNTLDIGTPSDSTVTNAKTNFVSTSSSAGLQIKGDGSTGGTLQLNCEVNSHGVKLRSPAHSAGQSYTLTLPTGNLTAGNVLKINSITGSGTTAVGQLEAPSQLTMPNQPAFCAFGVGQLNIPLNQNTNVEFTQERFDQGSDFDGTSTFTAPVTGRYQFNVSLDLTSLDSASSYYYLELQTSNELYYNIFDPDFGQDNVYFTLTLSHLVDMDSGDIARVRVNQAGGTQQTDIDQNSFFSGYLVC